MARTAMAEVRQKQVRALELVRAGHSYDEIAADLGYANRSSAWRLVRGGLDKQIADTAEDYRQLELERLDALQAAHWPAALAGDPRASLIVLRVTHERSQLLGLHRPEPEPRRCTVFCPVPGYATKESNDGSGRRDAEMSASVGGVAGIG